MSVFSVLRETIDRRGKLGREHLRRPFVSCDAKLWPWTTADLRQSDLRLKKPAQLHRQEARRCRDARNYNPSHGVYLTKLEHDREIHGMQRGHGTRNLRRRIAFLRSRLKAGRERLRVTMTTDTPLWSRRILRFLESIAFLRVSVFK